MAAEQATPRAPTWHALDIDEPWQVALYLPRRYDDFSAPVQAWGALPEGERHLLDARPASVDLQGGHAPRLRFRFEDATLGPCYAYLYGTREELQVAQALSQENPGYLCTRKTQQGRDTLVVTELVDRDWVGGVRPVYAVRPKSLTAAEVRQVIAGMLPRAKARAVQHLCEQASFLGTEADITRALGCEGWRLADVLEQVHRPASVAYAHHSLRAMEHLAALVGLWNARTRNDRRVARPLSLATVGTREAATQLPLTGDQRRAIARIAQLLGQPGRAHVLVSGDVGTGKTAVLGVIAAAVVDAGRSVVVIAPTSPLAAQLADQLRRWFPDLPVGLVTGATTDLPESGTPAICVGTTAILHHALPNIGVVMVDEQHRFSRAQREQFAAAGAHLIEASATCIPRTTALARFGACDVCELRETPFRKEIRTRFFAAEERRALFAEVREFVGGGGQLIVIYPERGEEGSEVVDATRTVRDALPRWKELCPRSEALTGQDDDATKAAVIHRLREGETQVLITTTVVEVGIDVPSVRGVLIMHPQHYGLATMHQIRGRVARHGGVGHCWIYAPERLPPTAEARVRAMLRTTDGFELSALDLDQRGWGNLAADSTEQSGADRSIVFGRPITPESATAVLPLLESVLSRQAPAAV